jgi:hypothetical protein
MFEVRWVQSALDDLTRVWLEADSTQRRMITAATSEIDAHLRETPFQIGESRRGNLRILLLSPIGVYYRVYPDDRFVKVLAIWKFAE